MIRTLDIPLDEIWMDFRQKVRKNVKKACSFGLQIIIENSTDHLDDFLMIYYSTIKRTEAADGFFFSRQFFEEICKMKDNVMFFHTVYNDRIISTELVLYDAENCYSYLGGTDRDYYDLRPNDYLKYEVIKWAKEKGLKRFVLGRGYGEDDGIFQYKLCLAPHGVRDFYIGRKIFDSVSYNQLVAIRNGEELNGQFFPLYRS